jgi:hypothetical protein
MKRLSVRRILFKVSGSHCRYCNTTQPADWDSASVLYHQHKSHPDSVRLDAVIAHPPAYAALRTKLELPLFMERRGHLLNQILSIPWTAFKIACRRCNESTSRLSEDRVMAFRASHRSHIEDVQILALIENARGQAIKHVFQVYGDEGLKCPGEFPGLLNGEESHTALRIQVMWGKIIGIDCVRCKRSISLGTNLVVDDFWQRHEDHDRHLRFHVLIRPMDECIQFESWIPLTEISTCCSSDGYFEIDSIVFQLICEDCGAAVPAPLRACDVQQFKYKHRNHPQAIRFRALLRGVQGRTFICTLTECGPLPDDIGCHFLATSSC